MHTSWVEPKIVGGTTKRRNAEAIKNDQIRCGKKPVCAYTFIRSLATRFWQSDVRLTDQDIEPNIRMCRLDVDSWCIFLSMPIVQGGVVRGWLVTAVEKICLFADHRRRT